MKTSFCKKLLPLWAIIALIGCGESHEESSYGADLAVESSQAAEQAALLEQQNEQLRMQLEMQRMEQEAQRREDSLREAYKSAIGWVLYYDTEAGKNNPTPGQQAAYMRNISLAACPNDFASVYIAHVQAWENLAQVERAQRELDNNADLAVVAGIIATLAESEFSPFSNYATAQQEMTRLREQANMAIRDTWQEVERMAVAYGIR